MFYRVFKQHPDSIDETYFEHAIFASKFALKLAAAAGAALVHALSQHYLKKQPAGLSQIYTPKPTIGAPRKLFVLIWIAF